MRIALILGEWLPNFITDYCNKLELNIEYLVSGIYFVKILSNDGNQIWYKKFIKD